MYKGIGGYDIKFDEFQETCRKTWSEKYNYLCIDTAIGKKEGKFCIFKESKKTYIECIWKLKLFSFLKVVLNQKQTRARKLEKN